MALGHLPHILCSQVWICRNNEATVLKIFGADNNHDRSFTGQGSDNELFYL